MEQIVHTEEYDLAKQIIWNTYILEKFIEIALLSEEEEKVLRAHVKSWTRAKIAYKYGMSLATVDRTIYRLKIKYDCAQSFEPTLPPRATSAKTLYKNCTEIVQNVEG